MGGLELPISKWDSLDSSLEAGSDLTSFDSKLLLEMASHENAAINFDSDAFCVNLPEFSTVLVGDFRPPEVASAMAYEAQTLPPAELDIPGNPLVGGPLERVATRFGLGPFRSTQRRENSSAPNDGGRDGGGGSKGSSASKTGSHSTSSESLPGKRPRRKASESGGKKRVTRKHPRGRVSSKFRGVTKHCHTGKFEAHLWNPNVERPQSCSRRKGKQVYVSALCSSPSPTPSLSLSLSSRGSFSWYRKPSTDASAPSSARRCERIPRCAHSLPLPSPSTHHPPRLSSLLLPTLPPSR